MKRTSDIQLAAYGQEILAHFEGKFAVGLIDKMNVGGRFVIGEGQTCMCTCACMHVSVKQGPFNSHRSNE